MPPLFLRSSNKNDHTSNLLENGMPLSIMHFHPSSTQPAHSQQGLGASQEGTQNFNNQSAPSLKQRSDKQEASLIFTITSPSSKDLFHPLEGRVNGKTQTLIGIPGVHADIQVPEPALLPMNQLQQQSIIAVSGPDANEQRHGEAMHVSSSATDRLERQKERNGQRQVDEQSTSASEGTMVSNFGQSKPLQVPPKVAELPHQGPQESSMSFSPGQVRISSEPMDSVLAAEHDLCRGQRNPAPERGSSNSDLGRRSSSNGHCSCHIAEVPLGSAENPFYFRQHPIDIERQQEVRERGFLERTAMASEKKNRLTRLGVISTVLATFLGAPLVTYALSRAGPVSREAIFDDDDNNDDDDTRAVARENESEKHDRNRKDGKHIRSLKFKAKTLIFVRWFPSRKQARI